MEARKLRVQCERRVDSAWSWLICFSSFMSQFIVLGTHNSFGSFFVALLQEFHRSEAETAWIGSLAMGLTFMCGPITTILCDRWGHRVLMCVGSIIYMAAMLMTSFVPHMPLMYITYSVLFGFSCSCCFFSSLHVLVVYFNRHLSLANGIAAAGAGAGTMSLSLMIDKLISTYGFRIAFRSLAALSVLLFLAGLTFLPVDFREEDECLNKTKIKEHKLMKAKDKLISTIKELLTPSPAWRNKAFVVWTVAMAMTLIAYYIPYMYLVRLAEGIGIPSNQGVLLVGYFALAQTVGKILFGKLGDSPRISRLTMAQISLLVIAVAACLCPLARSHTALLTYSLVSGLFDGCLCVMIGLVTHDIVGRQMMATAVGTLYGIVAIPMAIGPPMAGLLYDSTGNYNIVFFLSSGMVIGGSCIMFLVPNLVPSRKTLQKVFIPEITVSSNNVLDLEDDFLADQKVKLTSQVSLESFPEEANRSRLLGDRLNLGSRPNSFILFSIVPEGSFRDLSLLNERYSNSREASHTSLARLSEIRVDSRANSCLKLEPVVEAETSETSAESLEVITEPSFEVALVESKSFESLKNANTSEEEVGKAIVKSADNTKDGLPYITISKSTESGFISEESDTSLYSDNHDNSRDVSSTSDLNENRLSGCSWNSTGSDLSWKTQCSESDTGDSGYSEEISPALNDNIGKNDKVSTDLSKNILKLDLTIERSYYRSKTSLTIKDNDFELSDVHHVQSLDKGPPITEPDTPDCYSKLEDQSTCACEEEEGDFSGKAVAFVKEVHHQSDVPIPELPPAPDYYSQMFEGILEEVNDYVECFSELSSFQDALKTWPKVSVTDLTLYKRETVV